MFTLSLFLTVTFKREILCDLRGRRDCPTRLVLARDTKGRNQRMGYEGKPLCCGNTWICFSVRHGNSSTAFCQVTGVLHTTHSPDVTVLKFTHMLGLNT